MRLLRSCFVLSVVCATTCTGTKLVGFNRAAALYDPRGVTIRNFWLGSTPRPNSLGSAIARLP